MQILALDTSTSQGGVAVLRDDTVLSERTWTRDGSHGEHLTSMIESALAEAGLEASAIDTVSVGIGPGSFTGIRIAVNAARSIAYANKARAFVFDTTEILVNGTANHARPVIAMVNAQKNLIFVSEFEFDSSSHGWRRSRELGLMSLDDLETSLQQRPPQQTFLCIGDGYLEYESALGPVALSRLTRDTKLSDFPSPTVLGRLAWKCRQTQPTLGWKDVQALYIRASGAEEKRREGGKS